MAELLFNYFRLTLVIVIQFITVTLACVLILRSLITRFVPIHRQRVFYTVERITNIVVLPVRHFLPKSVCGRDMDFASLISAIVIILIGLGFEHLLIVF